MKLTTAHYLAIRDYVSNYNQTEAWTRHCASPGIANSTNRVLACTFFKRKEVKELVKMLEDERDKAILKATQETYTKIYSEQIASDLELDIFHTSVVRGQAKMQEVFAVKERQLVRVGNTNKYVFEERTVFRRVDRSPTIKEQQISASELYKRRGSYKRPLSEKPTDNQDDQLQAEKARGESGQIERFIILSDGQKLPIGI